MLLNNFQLVVMDAKHYRSRLQVAQVWIPLEGDHGIVCFERGDKGLAIDLSFEERHLDQARVGIEAEGTILVLDRKVKREVGPANLLYRRDLLRLIIVCLHFEDHADLVLPCQADVVHLIFELYLVPWAVLVDVSEDVDVWTHTRRCLQQSPRRHQRSHYKVNKILLL